MAESNAAFQMEPTGGQPIQTQPGAAPPPPPYTEQPPPLITQPQPQDQPMPYEVPNSNSESVQDRRQRIKWMTKPAMPVGCPPGLEYLTQIDQLLVKQELELIELITDWETANRYRIFNTMGQQVYFASEESGECMRQCCGSSRGFILHITDNLGQEVLRISREFNCGACCCGCTESCAYEILVDTPDGQVLGYVTEEITWCKPRLAVKNTDREVIGIIQGPCHQCQCMGKDIEFPVYSPDGPTIGKLCKEWTGFFQEFFTDADNFSVTFPLDMDVKMKATMLGALFLIDFLYFEENQDGESR